MTDKPHIHKELIDKYRDINVQHEWWDYIEDQFTENMETKGVVVTRILFTGFWSQGDGACFEGSIKDWGKYLSSIGYTDPILHDLANIYWTLKWAHKGPYYHENSVSFSEEVWLDEEVMNPYTPDDLRHDVWNVKVAQYHFGNMNDEIVKNIKASMKALYRELEEGYNSLTSDEAVSESIIANNLLTEELEY